VKDVRTNTFEDCHITDAFERTRPVTPDRCEPVAWSRSSASLSRASVASRRPHNRTR